MKKVILLLSIFFCGVSLAYAKEKVEFSACVDGDTFKIVVDDEVKSVRMLAVNTPELAHGATKLEYYGKEASEYTCNVLTNAKKIELEYDSKSSKTDKYGRILAWVFVDGELYQEKLIEGGYAKVAYLYANYKYADDLKELQEKVSAKGIGVWDTEAEAEFNGTTASSSSSSSEESSSNEETLSSSLSSITDGMSTVDIIIVVALVLVVLFAGDKTVKNKAKKKLKKYLD